MTLRKHYWKMLLEISKFAGLLIILVTIYRQFGGAGMMSIRNFWQILLLVSTVVFRSESLINFHDLNEHKMYINYFFSSILADVTLIILLYYFTPGGLFFRGLEKVMLTAYVVFKGATYVMIYFHSKWTAREINAQLQSRSTQ